MSLADDLTEVTRAHCLDARRTWPGAHACACGWKGNPEKPNRHGKPHHVHVAEVLAEWFEGRKKSKKSASHPLEHEGRANRYSGRD